MDIELRWIASQSANCFHAAQAVARGRLLADAELAEAVAEPTERLREQIRASGLSEEEFWHHLVPLSAGIDNNRQLIEVVFRKTIGTAASADTLVSPLVGRIGDVEAAVRRAIPALVDDLTERAAPLRDQWRIHGPGLLEGIARLTDQRLIVPRADVILLHAALGGAGAAHLPYNSVRIEVLPTDPLPDLPEVVRLAWLLAQLNVDLPVFSETIPRDRQPLLAALAMLPAVLTAAQEVELARCDPQTVARAVTAWCIDAPPDVNLADVVVPWWQTYVDSRPAWNVALVALDRMLNPES